MFNESQTQEIIKLYQSGKTQQELSTIYGCAQGSIFNLLTRNKIKARIGKKITYTDINSSFFKEINCEENAYFLGLLYADGSVQIKNNAYTTTLKLKSDDQIIIEKFRNIMSPSSPVKITTNKGSPTTYSYFRINQKEISDQLEDLGCVPNKSLILEFPTKVPANLIKHFLRGYSDGDGTIYKNKFKNKKTINTIWKIISTKQFCQHTAQILKEKLGVNCSQPLSSPKTNQITTTLWVGGNNQVEKVLDWLYGDATIYLPRKYEKYLEFKRTRANKPYIECKRLNWSLEDKKLIVQLYNDGMSSYKIAERFNASKPSILKILHNYNVTLRPNPIGGR
jgi:DNA-binding CsgD family transcriptional regulator